MTLSFTATKPVKGTDPIKGNVRSLEILLRDTIARANEYGIPAGPQYLYL